ncbi:putative peptide modification system cyclase [Lysobacter sp. OAE881]|uniref:putative peptide modification system cyclase n=1 Tax=Lysobacter sp. OAE881 TaxID=2663813 RepID=UPI00178A1CC7
MNEMTHRPSIEAPQLRTLLLTDLCDSTTLVERIGDVQAATLFRDHDRLVLDLQQRWRGRLIDRSDGLLLLFERPIDGLGFALDYVRELREMGDARGHELRARAGLHVGEVLTWRNSDEAVQVGAKPLEVEGLAKPMAARLMAMARPGQILLSAVAEPLAHRAARELGERGQHLLWKSHGRWRFKGVPDGQQIYEVGEPGIAPLRMPPNTPKAWRDLPLWRRPAALAAEAAIIAGIGVGVWFATRPAPAIAFNQRDWVVVADVRNLTGESVLDDSLQQAFRISLEQSRYVNVLSDLKARDTLARMRLKPNTVLDRAIASEIALRDGARAVILPTVAEVGGKVRVSAEVVDPHTQATILAKSADGTGLGSVLASIDVVSTGLRSDLGEAVNTVERDSLPLSKVSTANLDALRAYSLAEISHAKGEFAQAQALYEKATQLDPDFALAWIGIMRVRYAQVDAPGGEASLRKAQALRDRLAPREAMYVDAWVSRFDRPGKTTSMWSNLAKLYPDYLPAASNAAMWLFTENRFKESLAFATAAAVPQNSTIAIDYDSIGRARLALGEYDKAAAAFDQALTRAPGSSARRRAAVDAARGDFVSARKWLDRVPADNLHGNLERVAVAIDQGKWSEAGRTADKALQMARETGGLDARTFLIPAAVVAWKRDDKSTALRHIREAVQLALQSLGSAGALGADAEDDAVLALAAGMLAVRLGEVEIAKGVLDKFPQRPELLEIPVVSEFHTILRAEVLRASDKPADALRLLLPLTTAGHERFQARVALMQAYEDLGENEKAAEQARWLQQARGLAYIEMACNSCLQALNVADISKAATKA